MNASTYHSIRAVSSTWLRACDPPARLKYLIDNPIVPTEAMRLGSDIHAVILEGETSPLTQTFWKPEGMSFATMEGKQWKADVPEGGRIESCKFKRSLEGCIESLAQHPTVSRIRSCMSNEQVFQWVEDGVDCKAMLDSQQTGFIADIKSGSEDGFANPDRFARIAYDRDYHIQAAWYMHAASIFGKPADKFIFIAVETEPPFLVSAMECSRAFLNAGALEIDRRFPLIKRGLESGEWPGYTTDVCLLDLPTYVKIRKPTDEYNSFEDWYVGIRP